MRRLPSIDFVRFCLVGASGFVINFVLLTLLYKSLGLPLFIAQIASAEVALFNNFLLHHNWTYKNRTARSIPALLWQFHLTYWVAILGTAVIVSLGVEVLQINYVIALAVAAMAALSWNFAWTKYVIWRRSGTAESKTEKEAA